MLTEDQLAKLRTAGKVAGAARELGLSMVKEGVKLYDVAQEVEGYIREHGCGLAFPCNISINEIAAHTLRAAPTRRSSSSATSSRSTAAPIWTDTSATPPVPWRSGPTRTGTS